MKFAVKINIDVSIGEIIKEKIFWYKMAYTIAQVPVRMLMKTVLTAIKRNSFDFVSNALGTMFREVNRTCIVRSLTNVHNICCSYISDRSSAEKNNIIDKKIPIYAEMENMLL